MKRSFLQLACAAAVGVLAASTQAQYSAPSTPPAASTAPAPGSAVPPDASSPMAPGSMTSAPDATTLSRPDSSDAAAKSRADADFRAAQRACNAKTITDRDECLRNAQEDYIRALDQSGNSTLQDQKPESDSASSYERRPGVPGGTPTEPGSDLTGK